MPDKAGHQAAHVPRPSDPEIDAVRAAWAAINRHLRRHRDRIYREIKAYPLPIPACDLQYNYLLEQRARVDRELTRLDDAIIERTGCADTAPRIEQFIQSSSFIDPDTARRIRALLTRAD